VEEFKVRESVIRRKIYIFIGLYSHKYACVWIRNESNFILTKDLGKRTPQDEIVKQKEKNAFNSSFDPFPFALNGIIILHNWISCDTGKFEIRKHVDRNAIERASIQRIV